MSARELIRRGRGHSYNTRTNKTKRVRTPGNRLVIHRIKKAAPVPKCSVSGQKLGGLPGKKRFKYSQMGKYRRTVSRPYGGCLSHKVVRDNILKSFFNNEKLCVQAVLLEKARSRKAGTKKTKTKKN